MTTAGAENYGEGQDRVQGSVNQYSLLRAGPSATRSRDRGPGRRSQRMTRVRHGWLTRNFGCTDMGKGMWSQGKGFAKVGALYAGTECVIEGVSIKSNSGPDWYDSPRLTFTQINSFLDSRYFALARPPCHRPRSACSNLRHSPRATLHPHVALPFSSDRPFPYCTHLRPALRLSLRSTGPRTTFTTPSTPDSFPARSSGAARASRRWCLEASGSPPSRPRSTCT